MSLGACSVAVPVRDPQQEVIAALGIVVPSLGRHRQRLVAALQVAAAGVERTLPSGPRRPLTARAWETSVFHWMEAGHRQHPAA